MLFDTVLQLVAQNFWVVVLLYLLFLWRPSRILLWIAIAIAFLLSISLITKPEAFVFWVEKLLSAFHLLPARQDFDVSEASMGAIHRAFSAGFFWALASVAIFFMHFVPIRRLMRPVPES